MKLHSLLVRCCWPLAVVEYFTNLKISPPAATHWLQFKIGSSSFGLKGGQLGLKEAFPFRLPSGGNLLKGIEISNGFVELISSGSIIFRTKVFPVISPGLILAIFFHKSMFIQRKTSKSFHFIVKTFWNVVDFGSGGE